MSKLTDFIESKYDAKRHKSMRQFLESMGIQQQKFYNWKNGAVPEDKELLNLSEKLNTPFLKLFAIAKTNDKKGTDETRNEWRKITTMLAKIDKGDFKKYG